MSTSTIFDSINRRLQDALADSEAHITQSYAVEFLVLFRSMLKFFNLRRHEVRINAGMGSANLVICERSGLRGRMLVDIQGSGKVLDELRAIEAMLADGSDWSYHLDKQILT